MTREPLSSRGAGKTPASPPMTQCCGPSRTLAPAASKELKSMISPNRFFSLAVGILLTSSSLLLPQGSRAADPPGKAIVALYRVAPGKHLEVLKWLAAREAVDKEAGVPATQWYMHTDGDSWDFVAISPALSDAQQDKVDALAKKKGLTIGMQAALEFRQFVSSHTVTFVNGPTSAAQLVQQAQGH